jgi:hypothetical protein
LQRDLCIAHGCLGGVLQAQGHWSDALHEFRAYRQILIRLTRRNPENADWQRELAHAHNCVATVLEARGRFSGALRAYEAAKQRMLRLTERHPENADWQRELAPAHDCVSRVLRVKAPRGRRSKSMNSRWQLQEG